MFVGIIGTKDSGKSTVASMLQYLLLDPDANTGYDGWKEFDGIQHIKNKLEIQNALEQTALMNEYRKSTLFGHALVLALATPLKVMLASLLDEPVYKYENREFKESENPLGLCDKEGHIYTRRELLALLGTECLCDTIDNNTFVKRLLNTYEKVRANNVIVSDVRMPHEVAALHKEGAVFLYTHHKQHDTSAKHRSERGVDRCLEYLNVHGNEAIDLNNEGMDREFLFYKLKELLMKMHEKYEQRQSIKAC